MTDGGKRIFSNKLRDIFWPIHRHELKKFIPMSALMFCILFNQNILRILKDSIVITEISAEVTSFAKVYCVTPVAAIFVIVYAKMVNSLSFEKIHNYLLGVFVFFFAIFSFIIYPNVSFFHMDPARMEELMLMHPHLKWYIALVGNWSYIVFYVLSELWPNIFYILLFWQFANEITTTEEAKRFYTLFSLVGNSSLIVVGVMIMNIASESSFLQKYFHGIDNNVVLIQGATATVIISSVFSMMLVHFVCKNVMSDPSLYIKAKCDNVTREKMGIKESFKYISRSKYLWLLLICSAAFGLSMNLVEAVWKAKASELYSTVSAYAEFSGLYIVWTGIVIMVMTIIGNNIMRNHSWFVAAVITPVIIMISGVLFFLLVVFDDEIFTWFSYSSVMTPLALAVSVGTIQNIMAKGTKYSIWDTSREMLYIPLDNELRTKGKAAVDVISSKIGKSSSGLIQSLLFVLIPTATYTTISPFLMVVFVVVCIAWIYAVRQIYHEYTKLI
jgi:ATP:ADP antiporter, AAA family